MLYDVDDDALCNDGSYPVVYVSNPEDPPPGTPDQNDKIIVYLSGEGACSLPGTCAARADGADAAFMGTGCTGTTCDDDVGIYTARSDIDPPGATMEAGGIFEVSGRNPFAYWTKIYVYYCSSDNWTGQGAVSTIEEEDPVSGVMPLDDFPSLHTCGEIAFNGHNILRAVLEEVEEQYPVVSTILFAGSGAGSLGVRSNMDWVSEEVAYLYDPADVLVLAAADGEWDMSWMPNPHDPEGTCVAPPPEQEQWLSNGLDSFAFWNAFVDESCAAEQEDRPWICQSLERLVIPYGGGVHELDTPFFIFQNARDRVEIQSRCASHPFASECFASSLYPGGPFIEADGSYIVCDEAGTRTVLLDEDLGDSDDVFYDYELEVGESPYEVMISPADTLYEFVLLFEGEYDSPPYALPFEGWPIEVCEEEGPANDEPTLNPTCPQGNTSFTFPMPTPSHEAGGTCP